MLFVQNRQTSIEGVCALIDSESKTIYVGAGRSVDIGRCVAAFARVVSLERPGRASEGHEHTLKRVTGAWTDPGHPLQGLG
jgi:D-arabinose 5-phosphate isomerase GutQ